MQLDSARELKLSILKTSVSALVAPPGARAVALAARPQTGIEHTRSLALGVTRKRKNDFLLAVRIQSRMLEGSEQVEKIRQKASGEADIRYVGHIRKRAGLPWSQKKNRPLLIGCSVGHYSITAGTLGCFAHSPIENDIMILSNNHVLANENRAKKGDLILQPGSFDKGTNPVDKVGILQGSVRLQRSGLINLIVPSRAWMTV